MTKAFLPFNRPFVTGREYDNIRKAVADARLAGDGAFTAACHRWLESRVGCARALLTHSCTAALEMAALLGDIAPGDEVVMPSFTFVSTANAFVLRGAVPVFVDVRPDTLNMDETLVESAVTPRTRAVVPVHYAGVACEMDQIIETAARHDLLVIEDAAQGLGSTYRDRPLGSMGQLAATSFHETKNVISGEGGALFVNDARFTARAEIIREKGTNRSRFLRGQVDKYSWVDIGSSFLPGELIAAFLFAQMEEADTIASRRKDVWTWYYERLADLDRRERLRRPVIPAHCSHNAHMFYVLLPDLQVRTRVLERLKHAGIDAVFHYVPLHSSEAGRRFGRAATPMDRTVSASDRLIRLPLWIGMTREDVDRVGASLEDALR